MSESGIHSEGRNARVPSDSSNPLSCSWLAATWAGSISAAPLVCMDSTVFFRSRQYMS